MPSLLLLNGPPGIGKTTSARRYVADHQLALCLDIDTLRGQLGRWEDPWTRARTPWRGSRPAATTAGLSEMSDRLRVLVASRASALVIETTFGEEDHAYRTMLAAIEDAGH